MQNGLLRRPRRDIENAPSTLVIRNVVVGGRRTSVRLEPTMWDALRDIAVREHLSIHDLVTYINEHRTSSSLTAAIRVYIVNFYREAAVRALQAAEAERAQTRDLRV